MKKFNKILITGAAGRIGTILSKGLEKNYSLTLLDKIPLVHNNAIQIDIAKEDKKFKEILKKYRIELIIHLAWNNKEDFPNTDIANENKVMAENIYRAAAEKGVRRVIIASSVHADDYSDWKKPYLISPKKIPWPDTPYGATKIYIESLGKFFAKKYGIETVCVRFGGVNPKDEVLFEEDSNYDKVWLSSEDCVSLIEKCISSEKIPDNFIVLYGISNNKLRIHDISNPFGWVPRKGI